jgi:perosamine synthetase
VQLPEAVERERVIEQLEGEEVASKPYLPCIHLMPFYRGRFGYRGGEFPVAESIAERSLALPFFGGMGEEQVERVATALARAIT